MCYSKADNVPSVLMFWKLCFRYFATMTDARLQLSNQWCYDLWCLDRFSVLSLLFLTPTEFFLIFLTNETSLSGMLKTIDTVCLKLNNELCCDSVCCDSGHPVFVVRDSYDQNNFYFRLGRSTWTLSAMQMKNNIFTSDRKRITFIWPLMNPQMHLSVQRAVTSNHKNHQVLMSVHSFQLCRVELNLYILLST